MTLLELFISKTFEIPYFDEPEKVVWNEAKLRSYQAYLADCIERIPYLLGAAEMSLGKSAAALTGVKRLLRRNAGWKCIIVGPLEVAKNTWPDEILKWEHTRDLTYSVCVGEPSERLTALAKDVDILIINRENLFWLWNTIGGADGWIWQVMIYDESSRLKGFSRHTPGKKRDPKTKVVKKRKPTLTEFGVLAQARKMMKHVIELSGTPAPNGLKDLGGQAYILDLGERLGVNKTQFLDRYFSVNQFDHSIKPLPGAREKIMGLMKDIMIGLRSEDYIDLPPQVFNPVYVNLSHKLMKDYREFEKTLIHQEHDVEAVNKGVLTGKLLQFANGGLYKLDEDVFEAKRETIAIHDYKLKALENIVEEAAGQNILVAYSFKFDKERIRSKFPKAVFYDECKTFVKDWNAGKIQMGVAHPASIGHGLNLQDGGHIQVWFGLSWSLELWDQFNRRLARPGQENHCVFIHVIMARGTEDERQYETLQTKGITQDQITEFVRVRLKK